MKTLGKSARLYLAGCMCLGAISSLGLSQLLWYLSGDVRVESYAKSILRHAEMVAGNLTAALDELNHLDNAPCTPRDMAALKHVTFEYRFVKDSGRIIGNHIICSALWGGITPSFDIEQPDRLTRNKVRLWGGAPSYFSKLQKIDISSKGSFFVVTSPTAFAQFDSPSPELSATVFSQSDNTIMRAVGKKHKGIIATIATANICSEKYDICVSADNDANIFSKQRSGLLVLTAIFGGLLGSLAFYAAYQFRRIRNSLSYKLKSAITDGLITTAYQPIVHGATGEAVGFEVLARWDDKKFGPVSPVTFISKAEKLGLEINLHKLIFKNALQDCSGLLNLNPELYISFNINTKDLLDGSLLTYLSNTAKLYNVASRQIAIEVLEGATAEMRQIEKRIGQLREAGHKVLIDDFGSGYSSLSYLTTLNVDIIKIDKSFTQAAGTDSPAATVLQKVYEIANALQTNIVFEGVETENQKKAILEICPDALIQGWLFSKALPITELTIRIQSQTASGRPLSFSHT